MDLKVLGRKPSFFSIETCTVIIEITGLFYSNKLETRDRAGEKDFALQIQYLYSVVEF